MEFRGCRHDLAPIAGSQLPSGSDLPGKGGYELTLEEFPLRERDTGKRCAKRWELSDEGAGSLVPYQL